MEKENVILTAFGVAEIKDLFSDTIVVQGTNGIDVIVPYAPINISHLLNLGDLTLSRTRNDQLEIKPFFAPRSIRTSGFDPKVDKIRTVQGDFTLQEIFDHGHNAPFYKQARINCQLQKNCKE